MTTEPHLDPDELEWVVDRLVQIVKQYGTLGIEEGLAEVNRRMYEEGEEYVT